MAIDRVDRAIATEPMAARVRIHDFALRGSIILGLTVTAILVIEYWPFIFFPFPTVGPLPYSPAQAGAVVKTHDIDDFETIILKLEWMASRGDRAAVESLLRIASHAHEGFFISYQTVLQRLVDKQPRLIIEVLDRFSDSDRVALCPLRLALVGTEGEPDYGRLQRFESEVLRQPASSPTRQVWEHWDEWLEKWDRVYQLRPDHSPR